MMQNVLAVVMGGGRGSRLWPLTKLRAKPAVPIGGKYRLIDIPVSNCLNSDIHQIAILTQFNSVSLHRHISQTYRFDFFHPGWVQILAAEQTMTSADWYQGTADAVRKQLFEIQVTGASEVLVLAGDHLYRMDYTEMIRRHREVEADVTVGVLPVRRKDTHRFGILKQDRKGQITAFVEKPQTDRALEGYSLETGGEELYSGSMGIYLFRTEVLIDLLSSPLDDFGGDVIPAAIDSHKVIASSFDGYWEDIGTMRAFYEANLLLTQPNAPFRFHDPVSPIYTHPRFLPGSRIYDVRLDRVLLSDGCIVEGADLRHAVIGIRSVIGEDVVIEDTVIMGADYYEEEATGQGPKSIPMGIGRGSRISGAIIDKNARIGEGARIEPFPRGTEMDEEGWSVRDGIVVVPKSTVIPSGLVIAP